MLDYYLQITPHVSHAFTSCTHFTSYSLLSFVHEILCELVWSSKIIHFVMFDAKFVEGWFKFWEEKSKTLFLINLSWRLCVLKTFGIIPMHYMSWKIYSKLIMQKNFWFFQKFRVSIDQMCFSISWKFYVFKTWLSAWLDCCSIDFWSIKFDFWLIENFPNFQV